MTERVARVLEPLAWAALNVSDTSVHKKNREASIHKARLLIEVMQEPTMEMKKAGAQKGDWAEGTLSEEKEQKWRESAARDVWVEMIDVLLKE